jgi:hypothetical protein
MYSLMNQDYLDEKYLVKISNDKLLESALPPWTYPSYALASPSTSVHLPLCQILHASRLSTHDMLQTKRSRRYQSRYCLLNMRP